MKKKLGVMLDCSRNSVMSVDGLKRFIINLEKMGYNLLQLYTEDTYEIPEEPLFGYLRGRYSQEEIREIDKFAKEHGIELQPCIQTLAHLNQIFHWERFRRLLDAPGVLLAEEEESYKLIDNMFKSLANAYTSKTVNIGMDEALLLGAGKYFRKHGYKDKFEIFITHLHRVSKIAKKYGFNLLMWGDMFFRLINCGEYYPKNGEKSKVVPKEIRERIPDNVSLIYWDYYTDDQKVYEDMIDRHRDFGKEIWFAGGAWKWLGFNSANKLSFGRIEKSIKACNKKGVDNVILTMWGDGGNETPANAVLPSLLYASECLKGNFGMKNLKQKFKEIFGESFDDFMLLDMKRKDAQERCAGLSCGAKEFLYSDTFLGKFDSTVVGDEKEFFIEMERKFRRAKKRSNNFAYIFSSYEKLCKAMKIKYDLGFRTRKAYDSKDKEQLQIVIKDHSTAIRNVKEFIEDFRKMWFTDSKPHGFDIQDIRLGGVVQRLKANRERLIAYANGEIEVIPELEEKLTPVLFGNEQKKIPTFNSYDGCCSTNILW